jgi:diaminopimelate epimerase
MTDFYKYHGMGNDYLVIDPKKQKHDITMNTHNILLICNRSLGVGSDGILYGPVYKDGLAHLQIFNPDGSEAEKSGNGIRIFAQYLLDSQYEKEAKFQISTKGGVVYAEHQDNKKKLWKIDMGQYSFDSTQIPVHSNKKEVIDDEITVDDKTFTITCVTVGNPHCVIFQSGVTKDFVQQYGPLIEKNNKFPNRTNVQFVEVLDNHNIKIEIWERGAGYTLASGTSSIAASCASFRKGLVKNKVNVHMPGGILQVEIVDSKVFLTGPVEKVMEGDFAPEFIKHIINR